MQLDVNATGGAGIDWANVQNPTTALDLSGTDIQLVDTATSLTNVINASSVVASVSGNVDGSVGSVTGGATSAAQTTAQNDLDIITGADGVNLLTATQASIDAIEADTNELQGDWVNGGRLDLILDARSSQTSVDTIDGNVDSILVDTTEIGTAGAGLTDLGGMSTAMKAEVNAEADTALTDYDGPTRTEATSDKDEIIGYIDDLAVKKNAVFSNFEFLMVLTSDHVTPATGKTVTGQRSIDGAAFESVGGTITEVSNGIYQFDALAADTNGDVITWRFSETDSDDTFVTFKTVA